MQAEQIQIQPKYITTKDAASYLMIGPATLREFVRTRKIPCYRLNRSIRFRLDEIDSWIQEFKIDVHPMFKKRIESIAKRKEQAQGIG